MFRGPRDIEVVMAVSVPIRRRARCAPDPSPRLRWVVISERGQCKVYTAVKQKIKQYFKVVDILKKLGKILQKRIDPWFAEDSAFRI